MDARLLRNFLHVAELGSLTAASRRIHLSQPALSRQIAQLEHDLGVALFDRTGRGLRLTDAGSLLEVRARPLIEALERLGDEVGERAATTTGPVALALPPSVGAGPAAAWVEAFQTRYPNVQLRVAFALTGAIQDGVLRGSIDLGVIYGPIRSRSLHAEELFEEDLAFVGANDAMASLGDTVAFEDALAQPLLLPSRKHGLRAVVEGYAARSGHPAEIVAEVDSLQLLIELVRRGRGFTFLPERAVRDAAPHVVAIPVVDPALRRTASVVRAADAPFSDAARAAWEMIGARLGQLA